MTVKMQYRFFVGFAAPSELHTVRLVLIKEAKGCWKIDDFITPVGESLLQTLSEFTP